MKQKGFVAFCLSAIVASIYLFATAPVPLEAANARTEATVPVERVLDTVNDINAKARQIYTEEIVEAGKTAGLAFDEDWRDDTVEAGPLPALFLRATAAMLERDPVELGLFLGSDHAINTSNAFAGEQLSQFELLKIDGRPRFGRGDGESAMFGMYPDLASAQGCVTCHNEHRDTPKTDWRLGDIMGATTWTYPREKVSVQEYVRIVDALYSAIGEAYKAYLAKVETFRKKPAVGERWPRDGFFLPDADTFMAALRDATAASVILAIAEDAKGTERIADASRNRVRGSEGPRQRRGAVRPRSSDARRRGTRECRRDLIVRLRQCRMTAAEIAPPPRPRPLDGGRRAGAPRPEPPVRARERRWRRYERARPGDLIHLDVKKLARFEKPGHRVTRRRRGQNDGVGWEFVHVCIDDHSRLAYVEALDDETGDTCARFLARAVVWFARHGVCVRRVMTDNGTGYRSHLFRRAREALGLRHLRTRPYTSKTNGKAERFSKTLLKDWAYALPYRSSVSRRRPLPVWLRHYNHERPDGSLAGLPPAFTAPRSGEQPCWNAHAIRELRLFMVALTPSSRRPHQHLRAAAARRFPALRLLP